MWGLALIPMLGALAVGVPTPTKTVAESAPRLIVHNGAAERMWIANGGKDSGTYIADQQLVLLEPGENVTFNIPRKGLASTRFWPMMRCDSNMVCAIGQSVGDASGLPKCGMYGCSPPVDTKFEATFGCDLEDGCDSTPQGKTLRGPDYFDASVVDGFTVPFTLELHGCTVDVRGKSVSTIDGSKLNWTKCPTFEYKVDKEYPPSLNLPAELRKTLDLQIRYPIGPTTEGPVSIGCASPCSRLTRAEEYFLHPGLGYPTNSTWASPYCCPAGVFGKGQVTVEKCREMHFADSTNYHTTVLQEAGSLYTWAWDDNRGNLQCPPSTVYVMTFLDPPTAPVPLPTPIPYTPAPPGVAVPCPPGDLGEGVTCCTVSIPCLGGVKCPDCGHPSSGACVPGATCCNPNVTPKQKCPGEVPCPNCRADACLCPPSTTPPSPPTTTPPPLGGGCKEACGGECCDGGHCAFDPWALRTRCFRPGDSSYCRTGKCGLGEGDCDWDSHCQEGLLCGSNNCREMNPGEEGKYAPDHDCCFKPELGHSGFCRGQCGVGEGDCDWDSDCAAGLRCGWNNCIKMNPDRADMFSPYSDCCYVPQVPW